MHNCDNPNRVMECNNVYITFKASIFVINAFLSLVFIEILKMCTDDGVFQVDGARKTINVRLL